jgi:hypothetical protein
MDLGCGGGGMDDTPASDGGDLGCCGGNGHGVALDSVTPTPSSAQQRWLGPFPSLAQQSMAPPPPLEVWPIFSKRFIITVSSSLVSFE